MTGRIKLVKVGAEHEDVVCQRLTPATELRHFKNVTSGVMQDALNVWADLWGELQSSVTCGVMVLPEAEDGFKPSCGWPRVSGENVAAQALPGLRQEIQPVRVLHKRLKEKGRLFLRNAIKDCCVP